MVISTKEELREHIHQIHNLIRNSGAGYGFEALKIFNFFYSLKILEQSWEKLGLKGKKFSEFVSYINDEQKKFTDDFIIGNKIVNFIFNTDDDDLGLLYELNQHKDLQKIVVSKIPNSCSPEFYIKIILEINKIPVVNIKNSNDIVNDKFDVDIKGKTYEYFIGRDKNTNQELGAYFTDRHIINSAFDIIKPELTSTGKVQTMIDPFGGSGGMTLSYIQYLIKNNKNINWKENITAINHFDMMDIVVKSCALETFALTGSIPKMEEQFIITNSFKYEFGFNHCIKTNSGNKYNYVLTNPPFGGDKNKISEEIKKLMDELKKRYYIENDDDDKSSNSKCDKKTKKKTLDWVEDWAKDQFNELKIKLRDAEVRIQSQQVNFDTCSRRIQKFCIDYDSKIKEKYEKNKEFKDIYTDFKLKDTPSSNDKEGCSLILVMDLLDKDGVCLCVLKEGVLFDNKYSAVRKCLIDNYNVTHIISIPPDQFENTTTKTSIVIFKNNGQTEKIKFSEFQVEKYKEDTYEVKIVDLDILDENTKKIINIKAPRMYLTAHKDQIIKVKNIYKTTASYEKISAPTIKKLASGDKNYYYYSLNYKDYLQDDTYCSKGFILTKLKDLIKYKPKSKRQASFENPDGKYRFYTSSDKIKYCIECDIDDENLNLIFGTGGRGSLFIDNKFSCSADNFVCYTDNDDKTKYIYNYIKNNWKKFLFKMFNGSTLGHINKAKLDEYIIPFPKDIYKLKSQLNKLSILQNKISEITESIPQKEKVICNRINELTQNGEEGVDWNKYEFETCIEYLPKLINIKQKEAKKNGKYKFYTNGEYKNLYVDKCMYDKKYIIFGFVGNLAINIDKNFSVMDREVYVLNSKVSSNDYMYYLLKSNLDSFEKLSHSSTISRISKDVIKNINLKVLKQKVITKNKLDQMFEEIDKLKEDLEKTKVEYKIEINKFMEPLKDPNESDNLDENESDTENNSETEPIITNNKSNLKITKKSSDTTSNNLIKESDLEADLELLQVNDKHTKINEKSKYIKSKSKINIVSDSESDSEVENKSKNKKISNNDSIDSSKKTKTKKSNL